MGNSFADIKDQEANLICGTYKRYPIAITSARGAELYSAEGKTYTDLLAGISVCNLGHCHPELTKTISDQAQRLVHVSNLFYQQEQLDLARKILASCGLERAFFCNSGAEANEAAIKLARRFMHQVQGRQAFEVITLNNSFHGRTLATLTATGQDKIKQGFEPLPQGFSSVPPNELQALKEAINPQTAAILLEVIQGEGGVRLLGPDYLHAVQDLCREQGLLFMLDEVQTGLGRTGRMWAHQHFDLAPDVLTCAKALANGLPIGCMLCSQEVARAFDSGAHGTTFGGGALVSAVAGKVLDTLDSEGLIQKSACEGAWLKSELQGLQGRHPESIVEVRGLGLMLGIELSLSGQVVWEELLQAGFVCNLTQGSTLRLLPPLNIERSKLEAFVQALEGIISRHEQGQAY